MAGITWIIEVRISNELFRDLEEISAMLGRTRVEVIEQAVRHFVTTFGLVGADVRLALDRHPDAKDLLVNRLWRY